MIDYAQTLNELDAPIIACDVLEQVAMKTGQSGKWVLWIEGKLPAFGFISYHVIRSKKHVKPKE